MIRPTLYGQAIIFLVFVPLLTFTGVEGKTFSPMAITVLLALAGAFVASLTFVPAMVALLIRGEVAEKDVKAVAWVKERYEPVLGRVIARPWPWIGAGAGTFAAAALVFTMLGSEFLPSSAKATSRCRRCASRRPRSSSRTRMQAQVERTVAQAARSRVRLFEDRHRRGRQRSDAAECVGRLHHPQAEGRMAERGRAPRMT